MYSVNLESGEERDYEYCAIREFAPIPVATIRDRKYQQPTEVTPLIKTEMPPSSPRLSTMRRAALVVAAGVVTVCGASVLAGVHDVPLRGALHSTISVSKPSVTVSSTVVLTDLQKQLTDLYCRGPLLDAVQRAQLFNDSKHFVDMPIKSNSSATQILSEFELQVQPSLTADPASINPTLLAFLGKHFDEPGSETKQTVPPDFTESAAPPLIAAIQNPEYKTWALALHKLWKELGRSPSREIVSSYLQPTRLASLGDNSTATLIVVPGGRFRESYYWDSNWIVEGLMVSNMQTTARRVVQNLLEYVAEFGFVPNGGRIYYLTRSQPPLLSDMVRQVAKKKSPAQQQGGNTKNWDLEYLRAVVPILEKEYNYWMTTHRVDVTVNRATFKLNQYTATIGEPRPESYREDVRIAEADFPGNSTRQAELYNDIIAAAESGWDFSSRWFRDQQTLATIATKDILPVDLNAIMYRVETNLAEFYKVLGDKTAAARFDMASSMRAKAIDVVFWNEESGSWRDLILSSQTHSPVVSVGNYYPLWAGAFASSKSRNYLDRAVKTLRKSGLIQVAGVQTTTEATGQQWDAPNAWPPLQDILVGGLLKVNSAESRSLANDLVSTWIQTSYAAWNQTGLMFEKYNATIVGGLGAGGEYVPQFGFGWTNGVVLKFLTKYKSFIV